MSKLGEKLKSLLRRPRPVTDEEAAAIVNWVNEGGAVHPAGPPPIIGDNERNNLAHTSGARHVRRKPRRRH